MGTYVEKVNYQNYLLDMKQRMKSPDDMKNFIGKVSLYQKLPPIKAINEELEFQGLSD